jgi:hypothetical protein
LSRSYLNHLVFRILHKTLFYVHFAKAVTGFVRKWVKNTYKFFDIFIFALDSEASYIGHDRILRFKKTSAGYHLSKKKFCVNYLFLNHISLSCTCQCSVLYHSYKNRYKLIITRPFRLGTKYFKKHTFWSVFLHQSEKPGLSSVSNWQNYYFLMFTRSLFGALLQSLLYCPEYVFLLHITSRYSMWWYLAVNLAKYVVYKSNYCDTQSL